MSCSYVLSGNTDNNQYGRPWYEFPIYLAILIIVAILGPIIQSKRTRRMRMDEVLAEKKFIADGEAYEHMKIIASNLRQSSLEKVKKIMRNKEDWFFQNLLFSPGKFADMWLSIRNAIDKAIRLEKK